MVKSPDPENPFLLSGVGIEPKGDFAGFECRWNEIPSPHEETITILVKTLAQDEAVREATYAEILAHILECYGKEEYYRPIRSEQLHLTTSSGKLANEIGVQTAFQPFWKRWIYSGKLKFALLTGKWLIRNQIKTKHADWGRYKQTLVANSDYRKFDESIRMVISGTRAQRQAA